MSAIEVLCEIIAQCGRAQAATFRARQGYTALLKTGLIRETGFVQAVGCQECESPHDSEVVFEGGKYGFYCPDIGFVPLPRRQVSAVVPDILCLVTQLADAFECKRRKSTPVHGETWRVGAVETVGGDVLVFFHPRLTSEQDTGNVRSALAREVRSSFRLILAADGRLSLQDTTTALLPDVVKLDCETGTLTATVDPSTAVGAPVKRVGGTPNRFGKMLTRLIRSRIEDRTALQGRNEEAKAILEILHRKGPPFTAPSLSTIKGYLTEIRGG